MRGQKTGGRIAGSLNKATAEIKTIAQGYGPQAIEKLWKLAEGAQSEQAQVAACKEILDRGYGKAHQTTELTIDDKRESTDWSREELVALISNARNGGGIAVEADGCLGEPDKVH